MLFVAALCASFLHVGAKREARGEQAAAHLPSHYLLLVNTAIASMMDESKMRQFEKSPYDGLAVAFLHAYDTSEVPATSAMAASIQIWKKYTKKDIWPWVYVNRMIGFNQMENNAHAALPYFKKIAGADLEDASGSRSDFLSIWRNSLLSAKETNAPGVVCDLEFYNNYKSYDIGELARQSRKTPAEVAQSLKLLGAEMADSAASAYPNAVLWFLFTGITHPGYKNLNGVPYFPSPTYIAIGLLDEIAAKELPLKVLTGGEGSLAYCHASLAEFGSAIRKREEDTGPMLQKYRGVLELAGTMTLWSDRAAKKGWVNEGACRSASAGGVEELQPYLELLLKSYRYNWIYASADGNYLAFSAQSAPRFDAVIVQAKARSNQSTH